MKILLIKPSSYDNKGKVKKFKKGYMPFINLPLLKALTPPNIEIKIIDESVEPIKFDEQVDLVGITALTYNVRRGYDIANIFRKKNIPVVMGGFHVSALPDEALNYCDSVVVGEAENVWGNLLEDLKKKSLKRVYKSNSLFDLKHYVIPDYSSFNFANYYKPFGANMPMFPIQITRGCPFHCKFCSVRSFYGRTYRVRNIKSIINEIKMHKATYYFFVDDNIIGSPAFAKELFKALAPLKIRWLGQFSSNIIRFPELATWAAKAGCCSAYIGVESIKKNNLINSNKTFTLPDEYPEVFKLFNRNKIRPFASIIFGFDNDDENIFDNTVEFLIKNKAGKAYFYILTPLPGTELYKQLEKEERILTTDWNKYDCTNVVFKPKHLTNRQLEEGLWRAYKKFFSIRRILTRNLGYGINKPHIYFILTYYDLKDRKSIYKKIHPIKEGQ